MKVRVLYFAAAEDLASRKSEEIELNVGASVGMLADQIFRTHPLLRSLRGSTRYAVNLAVAPEDTVLQEGDEVGVLPPVAGG